MQKMKDLILENGAYLGSGILKVDSFINHQVDPSFMMECGKEFARLFANANPTRILTAEISGIAPAIMTGLAMDIPVVFARKSKPVTMPDQVYLTIAPSHTKGISVELIVSPEYLGEGERVLIIDDFLASGATIRGLVRLIQAAGATLVGIGALIEKDFEGGRELLTPLNIPIESLACITHMDENGIVLKD